MPDRPARAEKDARRPRWRPDRRSIAAAIAALALIGLALAYLAPLGAWARPDFDDSLAPQVIAVEAIDIPAFRRQEPNETRFGALDYVGGVALRSPSRLFGGFSGLALDTDGVRLLSVSDAGLWLLADITYAEGRIAGLANARMGALLGRDGRALRTVAERDAEAVTPTSPSGLNDAVYIAFERQHRIGLFPLSEDGIGAPLRYLQLPPEMKTAQANFGIEGLATMRAGPYAGRLAAFTERLLDHNGHHIGWLFGDGEPQRLALERLRGFDITGLAALPDGGLLVLERRFRWLEGVQMRIRHLRASEIRPGARMEGEVLIEAGPMHEVDNMEGIAVHEAPDGRTVITVISDDNFNPMLQRTLLLQFAWTREAAGG